MLNNCYDNTYVSTEKQSVFVHEYQHWETVKELVSHSKYLK